MFSNNIPVFGFLTKWQKLFSFNVLKVNTLIGG